MSTALGETLGAVLHQIARLLGACTLYILRGAPTGSLKHHVRGLRPSNSSCLLWAPLTRMQLHARHGWPAGTVAVSPEGTVLATVC